MFENQFSLLLLVALENNSKMKSLHYLPNHEHVSFIGPQFNMELMVKTTIFYGSLCLLVFVKQNKHENPVEKLNAEKSFMTKYAKSNIRKMREEGMKFSKTL